MTPLREIVGWLIGVSSWGGRDRWLAELVVRLVEERAENLAGCSNSHLDEALRDFDITPEQFEEIKGRLENDSQQG